MSVLPTTTKEYRLAERTGLQNLKVTQSNIAPPNDGEVLVKIKAVSLQFRDVAIATNQYRLPVKDNVVPCSDCAGEVIAAGAAVRDWKVGDRVCANFNIDHIFGNLTVKTANRSLGGPLDGVLAEYKILPAHSLVKVPEYLSFEEASTLPCAAVTAYSALFGAVPLKGGDYVLTQGTGGVSLFAAQIALACGAKVVATTSSEKKAESLRSLGVEHVINYKEKKNWGEEVLKITDGRGVDHVIEVGGAQTIKESFKCTKYGGWIHTIGFIGGAGEVSNLQLDCLAKSITLRGILVGPRAAFEDMNRLFEANKIKPVIDKVFPFDEASEAYAHLQSQKHVGKVVIRL